MRILGIDPGLAVTGFGILEIDGDEVVCGEAGAFETTPGALAARLKTIFMNVTDIINRQTPQEVAIEEGFYGKNIKVAMSLGQARGAALLACGMRDLPIIEYSPREVKLAVVGRGAASKEQVQYMIKVILKLAESPKRHDVSDALAVAYCHYQRRVKKF